MQHHRQAHITSDTDRPAVTVEMVTRLAARYLTTPELIAVIERLEMELLDRTQQSTDLLIDESPGRLDD